MQTPPPIPVEWLRGIINLLVTAMTTLCLSGKLTWLMSGQVLNRLSRIRDCLARTVARVEAGRYAPRRRTGKPRPPDVRRPWQPGPLPRNFGWLAELMPATAPGVRGTLEALLHRPDMVVLIEAAPVTLIPPLRSLCWLMGFRPPPILARPRRPRPAAPPPPDDKQLAARMKAPRPAPLPSRPPTRPDAPAWMQNWPPPVRGSRKLA
jgi:hypothetical protein